MATADYIDLITSEHQGAANFLATVAVSVQPFVDAIGVLNGISTAFNLDTAVGAQLDVCGQWIGVSRYIETPITGVYFSLDVAGLGLDQGYLQGQFDPSSGLSRLDDPTFRTLLYTKQANNNWDGTTATAVAAMDLIFNASNTPGSLIFIQDNQDMTMDFVIAGVVPTPLFLALFSQSFVGFVPEGVAASYYVTSISGTPAFGLDMESAYVAGLDVGSIVIPA